MTSTNFQVGFSGNNKNSSKVLKPPGGGSSDIFGGENQSSTPRTGKNHQYSNIFAAPDALINKNNGESTTRRNRNADSHNRLFGEPARLYTPSKNHLKSNIPIGGDETDKCNNKIGRRQQQNGHSENGNGHGHANGNGNGNGHGHGHGNGNGKIENGDSMISNGKKDVSLDGNPVTGEGYKAAGAEINTTIPSLNGTNQVINKNRVPPGGYSSGLW